jgi:hypothetical protein
MKIRIKGNSLRLRLTKTEVETFGKTGFYKEETHMLGGKLTYVLEQSDQKDSVYAYWENQTIHLCVPSSLAQAWTTSDEVGFQHIQVLPNGMELFLLVEKDFVCLDNTFEDQSDNYPNPNAVC